MRPTRSGECALTERDALPAEKTALSELPSRPGAKGASTDHEAAITSFDARAFLTERVAECSIQALAAVPRGSASRLLPLPLAPKGRRWFRVGRDRPGLVCSIQPGMLSLLSW